MGKLPPELALLEAKEIRPGDCFVLRGDPDRFFTVTRALHILGVDGEVTAFSENDVWEQFDRIEKRPREVFDQMAAAYREERWRRRGQPDSRALSAMAERFGEDYAREGNGWHWACRFDEETLYRLAKRAAELEAPPPERRKLFRRMYHDLVLAKALKGKQI